MPILSLNEIRQRAQAFVQEYRDATSESADSQGFWKDFFNVFGIHARRVGSFERPVRNLLTAAGRGRIDYLWKGTVLVEHKSRGEDLDTAAEQARDYFPGLKDNELPRYIVVSDFARFRLYDLERDGEPTEFPLRELPRRIGLFGFISGYTTRVEAPRNPVDREAADKLGSLHDLLEDDGFTDRALDVWMVRTLFCLFADSAGIFETGIFRDLIEKRTGEDGSDLGSWMTRLHRVLSTAETQRQGSLDDSLRPFPYVNGRLFDAVVEQPETSSAMRAALLDCCGVDWSRVSPAIFGGLFQSIKDRAERRRGGEHYTTEANILKCLDPLFLDALRAELTAAGRDERKLNAFLQRLRRVRVFDPACGCGNFLVVAYRELRRLELQALRARYGGDDAGQLLGTIVSTVNVDQMSGIEVDDWPGQIAQVALWLTDHQMNMELSEEFGTLRMRLPLTTAPNILIGNALREDWAAFVQPGADTYCVGNPPFIGAKFMSSAQKADVALVFRGTRNAGLLDYVACWYRKAAQWMAGDPRAEACFVSTNSITQGEQPAVLWNDLVPRGVVINFAHRTFAWTSEARGRAAVHCVIVGFALRARVARLLSEYAHVNSMPQTGRVAQINPYLVDAPFVALSRRSRPISASPKIFSGNQPLDNGNYLFTTEERDAFIFAEPRATDIFMRIVGADEFLYGIDRWLLRLDNVPPQRIRSMPSVMQRVEAVRTWRTSRRRMQTVALATRPTAIGIGIFPGAEFLAVPKVSSELRSFLPMDFLPPSVGVTDLMLVVPEATRFHFGILTSTMQMAWVRGVCGRLKSDFRYSSGIVYNNFPWPAPTDAQRQRIEATAQAILDARAAHPGATLADLYDPLTMPPNLVAAHAANDRAVDAAYGQPRGFATEAARLAFLFERHQALAAPLEIAAIPRRRRARQSD